MPSYDVINMENQKVETIDLSDAIFASEVKEHLFWEVVRMQMANRRSGTGCAKTRAEVAYTNSKMYRQKGTGRARAGSRRSGVRVGGGSIFGPKPRDFSYKVPKKVRKKALTSALSMKLRDNELRILDELKFDDIKTKQFQDMLGRLELTNVLFIIDGRDEVLEKSSRNIPKVKVLPVEGLNVYDLLLHKNLVIAKGALPAIERRFAI